MGKVWYHLFAMAKRASSRQSVIFGGVILALILIAWFIKWQSTGGSASDPAKIALAECLTTKGVSMYGAFWCPHCQNQKKTFGGAWEKIHYVECSTPDGRGQTPQCNDAGIEGYPTWVFPDGTRLTGEQPLQTLAEKAGCPFE
jgi:hypothetical protein